MLFTISVASSFVRPRATRRALSRMRRCVTLATPYRACECASGIPSPHCARGLPRAAFAHSCIRELQPVLALEPHVEAHIGPASRLAVIKRCRIWRSACASIWRVTTRIHAPWSGQRPSRKSSKRSGGVERSYSKQLNHYFVKDVVKPLACPKNDVSGSETAYNR